MVDVDLLWREFVQLMTWHSLMLGLVARLVLVDRVPLILDRFACFVAFICVCEV